MGVYKNGKVDIIANDQGNRITPSYVAFTDSNERLVGDPAKNQAPLNPHNTVFDAKRLIGRRFKDAEVQSDMKHWPFKIVDKEGKPLIQVSVKGEKKIFTPEEISAMVLGKMKDIAEGYLGEKVSHAGRFFFLSISRSAFKGQKRSVHASRGILLLLFFLKKKTPLNSLKKKLYQSSPSLRISMMLNVKPQRMPAPLPVSPSPVSSTSPLPLPSPTV